MTLTQQAIKSSLAKDEIAITEVWDLHSAFVNNYLQSDHHCHLDYSSSSLFYRVEYMSYNFEVYIIEFCYSFNKLAQFIIQFSYQPLKILQEIIFQFP